MQRSLWLAAAALPFVLTLHAQDPTPMTVVHLYKVKPGATNAWNANIKKYFAPTMSKLMTDGVVLGYGADEDILHMQKAGNYALWATVPNYAAYERVIKATDSMFDAMPEADRERLITLHDPDYHSDFIVMSDVMKYGAVKPGVLPYARMTMNKVKPGKQQAYRKYFEQYSKPVLDALVEKGTILGYSLDRVVMHTSEPGYVYEFVSVANLAAFDEVSAAFRKANDGLDAATRSMRQGEMREMLEMSEHRDGLMRAVVFATK